MAKDYARNFYNGRQWEQTQAAYMSSKNYICERCGDMARVVHHIKHITPKNIHDVNITLSWSNLMCLCHSCHQAIHGNMRITAEGLRFDDKGNLIQTPNL